MHNKPKLLKRYAIILMCVVLVASISAVIFWPVPCDMMIKSENGDITFYVVNPDFSNTGNNPTFTSEQWTISSDSHIYSEILAVMSDYNCHRRISNITQDNHQSWISIYSESGMLIFSWRGSDDFDTEDANYTMYGKGSGQNMMNTIYSILQSQ